MASLAKPLESSCVNGGSVPPALAVAAGIVSGPKCPVVARAAQSSHKTGRIFPNAAFCRPAFLELPSGQIDMAEACGSRTHHSTREEPNRRL